MLIIELQSHNLISESDSDLPAAFFKRKLLICAYHFTRKKIQHFCNAWIHKVQHELYHPIIFRSLAQDI